MAVRSRWLIAAAATLGVGPPPAGGEPAQLGPAVIADEILKPALDAIGAAWAAGSRRPAALSYVSSTVPYGPPVPLRILVAAGMPADVVLSGDTREMDALAKAGLIVPQTRRAIIGDDLVLIAPADAAVTLRIASGFDLARAAGEGKLALCAPFACAAGSSGRQALERLKVWSAVQPVLSETADERATLRAVGRGEAHFGIVYAAEAKADAKVKVVDVFPVSTYEAVNYAVALARASRSPDAASFIAFLRSGQATRILSGFGFAVLR